MSKTALIIGGGLGGLMTAALLGKAGYRVTLLEKNDQLGGRAGWLEAEGFSFDRGPSWYLMPDIFEQMFGLVGEKVEDHLQLTKLSPSYRLFYKATGQVLDITGDRATDKATFERLEPGAGAQLDRYLDSAARLYDIAVGKLLHKNYDSAASVLNRELISAAPHLKIVKHLHQDIQDHFKDPRLQQLLEYPAVFLGASPYDTPAFYGLLNHVLFNQGVYYPMGGIYEVVKALTRIGSKYDVTYHTDSPVTEIIVEQGRAVGAQTATGEHRADIVISNTDVHHTETQLLAPEHREYQPSYWDKRVSAPSALLLYLGVNRQYDSLLHHNLLFSQDWQQNFGQIFGKRQGFPTDPSLYVCAPSKTDPGVAPDTYENMFVLVPIAAGIDYTKSELDSFTESMLIAMEQHLNLTDLRQHLVYRKSFAVKDFESRLNSFRGTSLGLAHTLTQTAVFRPRNKSRKVQNLYYVGGDVHPGIGMPTTLISAELLYKHLTGDRSGSPLTSI
jgi:phytoene desaturase